MEIVKLRGAIKGKEADCGSALQGRTDNQGSKSNRSPTAVHSRQTKCHSSLKKVQEIIKEFIPTRSIEDSSCSRMHGEESSKRQKTITHVPVS